MRIKIHLRPAATQFRFNSFVRLHRSRLNSLVGESGEEVDFLPLEVSFDDPHANGEKCTLYASYNGGSCSDDQVIDLPGNLHPKLSDTTVVDVQRLHQIQNAASIRIEPMSPSDWELLEIYSQELEAGELLNQISVVYPHQIISFKLGTDIVYVRVLEEGFLSFSDKSNVNESSKINGAHGDDYLLSKDNKTKPTVHCCLRLLAKTEVIVTPKVRVLSSGKNDKCPTPGPFRLVPTEADFSIDMKNFLDIFDFESNVLIPCPPQFTGWVHPDTLSNIIGRDDQDSSLSTTVLLKRVKLKVTGLDTAKGCELEQNNDSQADNTFQDRVVAVLLASENVPTNSVALHPSIQLQLSVSPLLDHIFVQALNDSQIQDGINAVYQSVENGSLSIEVEPVTLADFSPVDFFHQSGYDAWHLPDEFSFRSVNDKGKNLPQIKPSVGEDEKRMESFLIKCNGSICYDKDVNSDGGIATFSLDDCFLSDGSVITLSSNETALVRSNFRVLLNDVFEENRSDDENVNMPFPTQYLVPTRDLLLLYEMSLKKKQLRDTTETSSHRNLLTRSGRDYFMNILPSSFTHSICSAIDQVTNGCSKEMGSSVLLTGDKGSGKTYLALATAAKMRMTKKYASLYLDCNLLQSSRLRLEEILVELSRIFRKAICCQPSLLILDDLHELVPNTTLDSSLETGSLYQQHKPNHSLKNQVKILAEHVSFLINGMKLSCPSSVGCILLCTCHSNTLHKKITNLLTSSLPMPSLDASQRLEIFTGMNEKFEEHNLDGTIGAERVFSENFRIEFEKRTEGYRPHDLKVLSLRLQATRQSFSLGCEKLDRIGTLEEGILTSISSYIPLCRQSLSMAISSSSALKWPNIGGLFQAKQLLSDAVLRPVRYRLIFEHSPVTMPRGILLFGPPGCGKTCVVPALAQQASLNLITCHGPELLDKYIGASEAKVRDIFQKAFAAAPSLLFLDEFEALAPRRGNDNTGVTDRIVNQLLTFLDGVEDQGKGEKLVYIIAASSRPDKIDPALLRPGRLETHIYIGYPESIEERNDLFERISLTKSIENGARSLISRGFLTNKLADADTYVQLSASDIKAVFDTAHLISVHEHLDRQGCKITDESTVLASCSRSELFINTSHLLKALSSTRPSLSDCDRQIFAEAYIPFLVNKLKGKGFMRGLGFNSDIKPDQIMPHQSITCSKLKTTLK